jgi:hydrogenase/urease accessory protein HupE
LALSGSPAEAHLVTTGLGPVYDGISHFLLSPEDLIPVFALGLLAGQCGPDTARRVLFVLPSAWLAGGLAGFAAAAAPPPDPSWLVFVLLGGLVATYLRPPQVVVMAIACCLGFFNGFINGSGVSSAAASIVSLISIAATVFVVTALSTAAVVAFTWPPAKIAVRVLGSWTTGTGMLLLGWSLR